MEPDRAPGRPTWVRTFLMSVLVLALTSGCGGPRACTVMGAFRGITLDFPDGVALRQGSVTLEICDDSGCVDARRTLGRIRLGTPPARQFELAFDALGRDFAAGPVTVTAEVRDREGAVVASGSDEVELTTNYPNGRRCGSDGVSGLLTLDGVDAAG